MADRDFDLRILKARSHYLAVVRSPDGEEATRDFELPISPERLDELFRGLGHPRKETRGGGSPEVRQARDVGSHLFEAVFAGDIRDVFQRSLGRLEARGGLRIRLGLTVPELLDLPWELLFERGRNRFLALEKATTLVRHLPVQQRIEPMLVAPPLHIVVAISNPGRPGYAALDVEQEWANLDQALSEQIGRGRVSLTRLDGVTQESLRQALKRKACHVLHYIGHGGYEPATETGFLVLEDKDGGARRCGALRLTDLLHEQPALRLVVLNACEGGRSSRTDPFAGVAQSLVQGAIPAVVAMQFPVTDAAAVVFAKAFYEALAVGRRVDLALAAARREVNLRGEEGEIEWATPVLYMRGDGELFSFEEREPVQPEPTDVTPTAATPTPGTGAAPTAEHDREKAEPAKTQPEEAGKKASQEPPRSPWKIAVPIIVLSAVVLGFNLIYTFQQPKFQEPKPAGDSLVSKGRELKQALEAFQLSSGRQEELKLPLPLKSAEAIQGQEIFNSAGKCFRCHANAGPNVPPGGAASGNLNFNTGVENLPDPTGDFSQPDDGLGITPAGDGTFNTPSLVEAADTAPFFHNNSVDTIEGAVAFYNSDAFNNSPAGQFLSGGTGRAIALDPTQVKAVAAFLRVINALDNIRELNNLLGAVAANVLLAGEHPADVAKRAVHDIDDAIMVLQDGGLHPDAVQQLQEARGLTEKAATSPSSRIKLAKQALDAINQAKSLILG